jgi:protein TonB
MSGVEDDGGPLLDRRVSSMKLKCLAWWSTTLLLGAASANAQVREPVTTGAAVISVPSPDDYYPATSKHLREAGVAGINACYENTGRVITAAVAQSSGYSRLDEAAIRLVRLVRVRPGTVDGKVVTGCLVLPIEFRLQE